jgi:inhibitor of KinA
LIFKTVFIPSFHYTISPLNENTLLVSFENNIAEKVNEQVIALQQSFAKNNFKGFVETVPAYTSLAIFYDTVTVRHNYTDVATAFDFVKMHTEKLINEIAGSFTFIKRKTITIPVYYNGEDLEHMANQHQLSIEQVIKIHSEKTYRVFMIGFLPGFAYMGKVDERIATPRLSSPRKNVKAGSVGIHPVAGN